jgi:hypothetical protein
MALLEKVQTPESGWAYRGADEAAYPRMTAAGACSWVICRTSLAADLAPDAAAGEARIVNARNWLERSTDPSQMGSQPDYYLLWSVERFCMTSRLAALGTRDWYAEGASILLRSQGADGVWAGGAGAVPDTCMALLFLRKAFVARPDIATESARKRATPEQALAVLERRREALAAKGVKSLRVEQDGDMSVLVLVASSEADAARLRETLGRDLDGVPLKVVVE